MTGAGSVVRPFPIFAAFAMAYFLSALLRAVTATLAPEFSRDLGIGAGDLGLLAGAYFLGFSLMQLPLGQALDRHGPKPVLLMLLVVAAVACAAFAQAQGLLGLVVARVCIGVGVSACLMAPLTCFRHLFAPALQLRSNSWMLMTGSLGMLTSTVPVQVLLPVWGWRGLFWALAVALVLSVVVIAWLVPHRAPDRDATGGGGGYREIVLHPLFGAFAPLGFFVYGGLIAWQALWIGPWLTRVVGLSPSDAAHGLLVVNACMLLAFLAWGFVMPRLVACGIGAAQLARWGVPLSLGLLALNAWLGSDAGAWHWAAWCVATTAITPSQPALGQAFEARMAGRSVVGLQPGGVRWGVRIAMGNRTGHRWPARPGLGSCCRISRRTVDVRDGLCRRVCMVSGCAVPPPIMCLTSH